MWIAFTSVKLLNSHAVVFKQYQKKYCILYIAFSKFKQMFTISFHFAFHHSFRNRIFSSEFFLVFPRSCIVTLIPTLNKFQKQTNIQANNNLKTLHQQFYWDSWKVCIHFGHLRARSISLKTINTSESFKSLWS